MNTIKTNLITEATFSDDGLKRYSLIKIWDTSLPKLTIVMLAPSEASGIVLDTTTQLVLNNASRLGYGSVMIVNLFAALNDFDLRRAEGEDPDNLKAILAAAESADHVIYGPGTGKAKSKVFLQRQEQVLNALLPYESKLKCLCNESGRAKLQHPLSPAVRQWHLSPLLVSELIAEPKKAEDKPKRKAKEKTVKTPNTQK